MATLPQSFSNTPSGAAIRIHPNDKFLYVSNRGYDHITIFEFDKASEELIWKGYQFTSGHTPREISIDPTGKWLLCTNQDSDNIVIFSIDPLTGLLSQTSINTQVKTASCLVITN